MTGPTFFPGANSAQGNLPTRMGRDQDGGDHDRAQQERSSHKAVSVYTDTDVDAKDTQCGPRAASQRDTSFLEYGEHPAMVPISKDLSIVTTVT